MSNKRSAKFATSIVLSALLLVSAAGFQATSLSLQMYAAAQTPNPVIATNTTSSSPTTTTTTADSRRPSVLSVTATHLVVTGPDAGSLFNVTATFSEPMRTGRIPEVKFTPSVTATLSLQKISFVSPTQLRASYTIADSNVEVAGVDISIAGGRDLAGNLQVPASFANVFDIDTREPLPSIDIAGGTFAEPKIVTVTTDDPSATIYYTTDGTVPTTSGQSSSSPLVLLINENTLLQYFARDGNNNQGNTFSETYAFTGTGAESATGAGIVNFTTSVGTFADFAAVPESALPAAGKPSLDFTLGFFAWNITGVPAGGTVNVTMISPSVIESSTQYWKVINDSWVQIPPVQVGSNDGADNKIFFLLTDDSIYDANPEPGVVGDPGGPGVPVDVTGPATSNVTVVPSPANIDPELKANVTDAISKITATEYFIDVAGANGTGISMAAEDDVFDELSENVTSIIPIADLSEGVHTAYVHGQDELGTWGAFNLTTFIVDRLGPATPEILVPTNDTVTTAGALVISGTSEANATVFVIDNDVTLLGSAIANMTGQWSFTPIPPLSPGTHSLKANATDGAGNASPRSDPVIVTIVPTFAQNATTITLNQTPDVVAGTSFTVSGKLTSAASGDGLSGRTVTINGTGIPSSPLAGVSVTTEGITFTDATGGVDISSCTIGVDGCSEDFGGPDDDGQNQVLRLDIGASITFPAGTKEVKMFIQDMGEDAFTLLVTEGNEETSLVEGAGSTSSVPIVNLLSDFEIRQVDVLSVDDGGGSLGIAALQTLNPAADPQVIHTLSFEDRLTGNYASQLEFNAGSFFFIGTSQLAASPAPLTLQAHFAGDEIFAASDSVVEFYSTIEPSWSAGAGGGGTIIEDLGTGVITLDCASGDDTDNDGICDSWENNGIPYRDGAGVSKTASLWFTNATGKVEGPTIGKKDIFVEIDAMSPHAPDSAALKKIRDSLAAKNISVHFVRDETTLAHKEVLNVWKEAVPDADPDNSFFEIKQSRFGNTSEHRIKFGTSGAVNGVTQNNAQTNPPSLATASTSKTMEASGITITANGPVSQGRLFIKQVVTLGAAATITGTPTVARSGVVGAGVTINSQTVSISPATSSTVKTITITVTFTTAGAVNTPASIGTYSTTFNTGSSVSTVSVQTASNGGVNTSPSSDISTLPTNPRLQAEALVYHYALFAHSVGSACGPSGVAEVGGNDLVVSLGCNFDNQNTAGHVTPQGSPFAWSLGSIDQQAGTLMHELGHNLNLDHGGARQLLSNVGTGVSAAGPQTNGVTPTTSSTTKTGTISGLRLTTAGSSVGEIIARTTITLGTSTTVNVGTPTVSNPSPSIGLSNLEASVTPGPSFASTSHTLTIRMPFTAIGQLNAVSIGTISAPLTLGTASTITSTATVSGSPLLRVGVSDTDFLMNCKPNYLSVMSYSRQFPYYLGANWKPTFSSEALATLDENNLVETAGISSSTSQPIVWGTPLAAADQLVGFTNSPTGLDWSGTGGIQGAAQGNLDINDFGIRGCGLADDGVTVVPTPDQVMKSFIDFDNLKFNFRTAEGAIDGSYPEPNKLLEARAVVSQDILQNIKEAGTVQVSVDSVTDTTPAWGVGISASGAATNAAEDDYVQVTWKTGSTSAPIPLNTDGTWTSPTFAYSQSDIGEQVAYAELFAFDGTLLATSTLIPVVVEEPPEEESDFTVSLNPASKAISRGQSAAYEVSLLQTAGTAQAPITLSVSGLPAGTTATLTPPSVTLALSNSSVLFITTTKTVAPGNYTITVTGTGGSDGSTILRNATAQLVIAPINALSYFSDTLFIPIDNFDITFQDGKITSTTPSTIQYNKLLFNSDSVARTVTLVIDIPPSTSPVRNEAFCLKGPSPVKVYGYPAMNLDVTSSATITPSQPIAGASSSTLTCVDTVTVSFNIPANSFRLVTVKLGFNAIGATGFPANAQSTYVQAFKVPDTLQVTGVTLPADPVKGMTTIAGTGKNVAAIGGFALDANMMAGTGMTVRIYNGAALVTQVPVSSTDGSYLAMLASGNTYTVKLYNSDGTEIQSRSGGFLSANEYNQVDFMGLNPATL